METNITDRQIEIIAAAGKILTDEGVGGLTIKNLAKEMQFSESAIYRHFTSKEEIIIAMLDYLAFEMDKRFTASIQEGESPERKFEALFKAQLIYFSQNPFFTVAIFSDGLFQKSSTINKSILNMMAIRQKHLTPIVLEGQKKKKFTSAISSEELVHVIMGAFRLLMFKWRTSNFQFDINMRGESMIETLLTLIKYK